MACQKTRNKKISQKWSQSRADKTHRMLSICSECCTFCHRRTLELSTCRQSTGRSLTRACSGRWSHRWVSAANGPPAGPGQGRRRRCERDTRQRFWRRRPTTSCCILNGWRRETTSRAAVQRVAELLTEVELQCCNMKSKNSDQNKIFADKCNMWHHYYTIFPHIYHTPKHNAYPLITCAKFWGSSVISYRSLTSKNVSKDGTTWMKT